MMVQDIRGSTACRICNHLGVTHVAGFFCVAKDCQCGHAKDSERHQMCCAACAPRKFSHTDTTRRIVIHESTEAEPDRLLGFSTPAKSAPHDSLAEFKAMPEEDLP